MFSYMISVPNLRLGKKFANPSLKIKTSEKNPDWKWRSKSKKEGKKDLKGVTWKYFDCSTAPQSNCPAKSIYINNRQ
jgi:hypothetical protein